MDDGHGLWHVGHRRPVPGLPAAHAASGAVGPLGCVPVQGVLVASGRRRWSVAT